MYSTSSYSARYTRMRKTHKNEVSEHHQFKLMVCSPPSTLVVLVLFVKLSTVLQVWIVYFCFLLYFPFLMFHLTAMERVTEVLGLLKVQIPPQAVAYQLRSHDIGCISSKFHPLLPSNFMGLLVPCIFKFSTQIFQVI